MEQTACWAALAFCSGWVAREFFVSKPPAAEPPACTCNCHWQGKSTEVTWNPPYSVLIGWVWIDLFPDCVGLQDQLPGRSHWRGPIPVSGS